MKKELCIKSICLAFIIAFTFVAVTMAEYLTADPQPSDEVTKYQLKLNGEIIPSGIEQVGTDQVRLFYSIDHLDDGRYSAFAQAGNDGGEWSDWSDELIFYRGVPTPQNIGLYCVIDEPITDEPVKLPQENFSVYHFSSQEIVVVNNPAKQAIDGKASTIWITDHSLKPPHEIQINLGKLYTISGLYVLPRQDEGSWGMIEKYDAYVSLDGEAWIKMTSGSFPLSKDEQFIGFDSVSAQYISLVGLSSYSGGTMSVAEINILGF